MPSVFDPPNLLACHACFAGCAGHTGHAGLAGHAGCAGHAGHTGHAGPTSQNSRILIFYLFILMPCNTKLSDRGLTIRKNKIKQIMATTITTATTSRTITASNNILM